MSENYYRPETIDAAIDLAKSHIGAYRYIAGGTDAIVNKMQGNDQSPTLIDLTAIPGLREIKEEKEQLRIGALITLDELANHPLINGYFPVLAEAATAVATPVIRKTATLGGNLLCENRCVYYNQSEWWRTAVGLCLKCDGTICIATQGNKNCFSKFVSDTAVALIALNASVEFQDDNGTYIYTLEEIYSGNGITPFRVRQKEIMKSILVPVKEMRCIFSKLRVRESVDFSSLTTAVSIDDKRKLRIVLGALDPGPILVEADSNANMEDLIRLCVKRPRIVDNDVYPRQYRKDMIEIFLRRSFAKLKLMS